MNFSTTVPRTQVRAARALGDYGERLAVRYLCDQGLTILDRNWRCVRGEIDIVALDEGCLVIVEVKTRSTERFGAPFEAVTRLKLARLRQLSALWRKAADPRWGGLPVRIDVVSILKPRHRPAHIEHLRGVE
ncbi:MAG: YraN family protein [Intrasporangium sp.]|uniref:YraN family protein n=1 Tax=Intrasporangium sp. TaxID=1925024 RepID=UPI0026493B90|nr:YraN family protein [Intrasporangium sp.]MDN5794999.1 YraN family protein [Intrasporangium sp.]